MRLLAFALLLPASVAAQQASQQQGGDRAAWLRDQATRVDTYESERAKDRAKLTKLEAELTKREDAWLAFRRDVWGSSEANLMDPDAFARGVRWRREVLALDDTSASAFMAGRRSGEMPTVATAFRERRARVQSYLVGVDTALKYAKDLVKWSQRGEDAFRSEDVPTSSMERRTFVKRAIEYYEKLVRVGRARVELYGEYQSLLRAELALIDKEIAIANAGP